MRSARSAGLTAILQTKIYAYGKSYADTKGFEELVNHSNVLNRKLEEVHGIGKEFSTVAGLWGVSIACSNYPRNMDLTVETSSSSTRQR